MATEQSTAVSRRYHADVYADPPAAETVSSQVGNDVNGNDLGLATTW